MLGWAVFLPLVLPVQVVNCLSTVSLLVVQVAAFILGRGALTLPLTLFQFTAVMLAPFMPAEIAADKVATLSAAHPGGGGVSPFKLAGELVTCAAAATCPACVRHVTTSCLLPPPCIGLPHLQTVWQRVSPAQRFSIDSSRSSSMCSSGSGSGSSQLLSSQLLSSSTPSPLDSPRIAAVQQQQGPDSLAASGPSTPHPSTPTSERQSATPAVAAAPAATDTTQAAAKVLRPTFKPSRLVAAPATVSGSGNSRFTPATWQQAANLLLNVAVTLAFLVYSCHSWAAARAVATQLTALWVMWRGMEALMWSVSRPARTHLGMTLAPHFINPFASTSLTDFWARRWNITQVC